jgi:hypothetical protein
MENDGEQWKALRNVRRIEEQHNNIESVMELCYQKVMAKNVITSMVRLSTMI